MSTDLISEDSEADRSNVLIDRAFKDTSSLNICLCSPLPEEQEVTTSLFIRGDDTVKRHLCELGVRGLESPSTAVAFNLPQGTAL